MNNLAELYRTQGDYEAALPLYERALKILQAAFGERHPNIAITLENMAGLHGKMGNTEKAAEFRQKAARAK